MKRQAIIFAMRQTFGLPRQIQRIEETASSDLPRSVAQNTIGIQRQRIPRKREQNVVARLRRAAHHTFEQAWITCWKRSGRRK
jgi:hypothetical protein